MKTEIVRIWQYNRVTGYWLLVRDCYRENAKRWLEIFSGDQPGEVFKAQLRRPKSPPTSPELNL